MSISFSKHSIQAVNTSRSRRSGGISRYVADQNVLQMSFISSASSAAGDPDAMSCCVVGVKPTDATHGQRCAPSRRGVERSGRATRLSPTLANPRPGHHSSLGSTIDNPYSQPGATGVVDEKARESLR